MWEMIERMASDLWIYTGIADPSLRSIFDVGPKIHAWDFQVIPKFDALLDYLVKRWGWTWLQEPDDVWRKTLSLKKKKNR